MPDSDFSDMASTGYVTATNLFLRNKQLQLYLPIEFSKAYHYKFEFKSLGATYTLRHFRTDMRTCNSCFLGSDKYEELAGYQVNG